MYVDYLELTNFAFSHYRSNLLIDPNFKIYFADCNLDPAKVDGRLSGLVWVHTLSAPTAPRWCLDENSSNICLMNAALADSPEISSSTASPTSTISPSS